jgi:hypothetical protein
MNGTAKPDGNMTSPPPMNGTANPPGNVLNGNSGDRTSTDSLSSSGTLIYSGRYFQIYKI